jgi:hypothetical protein
VGQFKDGKGRDWHLSIDVFLVEEIEKRTEVRVDKLLHKDGAGLLGLLDDPVKFVRVLWLLVEEQAEKLGVTPEDFGRALKGDPLDAAAEAFFEALVSFSPSRARPLLRTMAAKSREIAAAELGAAEARVAAIDPASFVSATNSPESSGSTPAPAG